jgi:predicted transcriptional regulator
MRTHVRYTDADTPMPTLTMRLDDDLDQRLSREAELAAETRSELARRAIEEFLSRRQRQRFLDEIARAARARGARAGLATAEEALRTDNEALALAEQSVAAPRARYRVRRRKR